MNFQILTVDIENQIPNTLQRYALNSYLDIDITNIKLPQLQENLTSGKFNLAIIDDEHQEHIAMINQDYEIPVIVLGKTDKCLLVQSYKAGALNYMESKEFLEVFPQILHEQLKIHDKKIQNNEKIQNLIHMESLTQLPNRSKLIEDLQDEKCNIHSLSIIDINSFKEINDFYGHHIGDFILKSVATVILDIVNESKELLLYKFPSDTYCVTNTTLGEDEFTRFNAKILQKIENITFSYKHNEIHVRATAGISYSQKNNKLITADLALQSAKNDNKELLVFYDQLDNLQEYQNNMLWTKKIKHALYDDNIIVYYQPLVNNQTLEVEKYECLVRLVDDGKVVSPFFFLDISKKSNQYSKITKVVLEKSFKTFSTLNFNFSVNISYEDIASHGFLDFIKELLQKYDVAHQLIFELLEDESVKNYDVLHEFIAQTKALGCKIAIDDFGSGYSNFEKLLKMDADFLKIDASLIKNITTDKNSLLITKTIVKFAQDLNLKTIAEFVENKEIFLLAKQIGVDYSQGYYFAPPLEKPTMYHAQ